MRGRVSECVPRDKLLSVSKRINHLHGYEGREKRRNEREAHPGQPRASLVLKDLKDDSKIKDVVDETEERGKGPANGKAEGNKDRDNKDVLNVRDEHVDIKHIEIE
jgi:hypothetical protein